MNLEILRKPLQAHEIEFRVQSISANGWATLLAYKDARCDMKRLDEAFGVAGWQRLHKEEKGMLFGGVSIWDEEKKQWIEKWDVGEASNAHADKGLASDSFKRACFNLGIGRELYDYPLILVRLNPNEFKVEGSKAKQTWDLKIKEWVWHNQFDNNGNITYLGCYQVVNGKRVMRFEYGKITKAA